MSRILRSLAFLCLSLALPSAAAMAQSCQRHTFPTTPAWVTSVVFDPVENRLVMADPVRKALWAFRAGDQVMPALNVQAAGEDRETLEYSPLSITATREGFLVQTKNGTLELDRDLQTQREVDLAHSSDPNHVGTLGTMHSGWISHQGYFLGFGAILGRGLSTSQPAAVLNRQYEVGFVFGEHGPDGLTYAQQLRPFEHDLNVFYRLGLSYFAANDEALFFVQIAAEETSVWQVTPNGRKNPIVVEVENAVPSAYRSPGGFEASLQGSGESQLDKVAQIFGNLEGKTMVAGILGHGSSVFLLTREPSTEATLWSLWPVAPSRDKVDSRQLKLPTAANHINLVPGLNSWYIIEKGPVRGWGDQEIQTVLEVPAQWIIDPRDSTLISDRVSCSESP